MSTYTTYLADLQRHFSRWAVPAPYAEQMLAEISGLEAPVNPRDVTGYYTTTARTKAVYVRDNGGGDKAQVVIDTLDARRAGTVDPQPPVVEPANPFPKPPIAPNVTATPVNLGPSGSMTGWGDGELTNFHIERGLDLIKPSVDNEGLVLADGIVEQCREFITPKDYSVSMRNWDLDRLDVVFSKRGMFFRRDSHVDVSDVLLRMGTRDPDTGEFVPHVNDSASVIPVGVQMGSKKASDAPDDTVSGTFTRVVVEDVMTVTNTTDKYENGDGFIAEGGDGPITYNDCVARRCVDAGFDIKCKNVHLNNCTVEETSLGFKLWSAGKHGRLNIINPKKQGNGKGKAITGITLTTTMTPAVPTVIEIDYLYVEDNGLTWHMTNIKGPVTVIVHDSNLKKSELRIKDPQKRITLDWRGQP